MTVIMERTSGSVVPTFDIMVDYDDVIMPWAHVVHEKCGQLELHDGSALWKSWHMWEDYGVPKSEWLKALRLAVSEGLYTHTDPFPTAIPALSRLLWSGHRIHIVTARGFMEKGEEIRGWTREHIARFGVPHRTLTFAKDKVEAMEALEITFDFAIDDGAHNYEALDAAGVPIYLHDQPHNLTYEADRRVDSLWQFADIVLAAQAEVMRS